MKHAPTAPLAAGSLIAGFSVAVASGSRPLGGVAMALGGLLCIRIWLLRDGPRTAAALTAVAFIAFVLSHLLGLLIGAWPAVLLLAAATAAVVWVRSDTLAPRAEAPVELRQ